jgi:7-alpha-hydroxysteroid dehydrogenase
MSYGMAGKAVIVTGAANGIGLAVARRFVRAGASVMMADIDERKLGEEVAAIADEGFDGRAHAFHGDLRERLSMANLMAATIDAYEAIDVLVNACRIVGSCDPIGTEEDGFEDVLKLNVVTAFRISQLAARRMIARAEEDEQARGGAIINITSTFGRRTLPGLLSYSVSCAALDQLTRTLAVALAPEGIRVNAVAAGGMTGRAIAEALGEIEDLPEAMARVTPLGTLGEPADAAEAALFLASPAARFVTGQIFTVDGGRLLLDPLGSVSG